MPERKRKTAQAIATGFAALTVSAAILWIAPSPLAAQNAGSTITAIYGNDSKLAVKDWHFVYEYLESDTPLDPAYVATCRTPSYDATACFTQIKTGKVLFIIAPLPGPSAAAQAPFLLPENTLQVIFLHWKRGPEPYEADGVTLNQNRSAGRFVSDGVTIVTTHGAQIRVSGELRVPESFLSSKSHVYLMKLSLAGTVQVQGMPGRFELRLDSPLAPDSLKERVEEIQFQPEPETDRAKF